MSDLALDDGTVLGTTEDHPFWSVTDGRFERSDELAAGEKVLTADGRVLAVDGLDIRTARTGLAYNLAVEGIHTYHVGDDAILVHNTCPVFGLDDAFASGQLPSKGGVLSRAGRALQKKRGRSNGAAWPSPAGKADPAGYNGAGENLLMDMLTDPSATWGPERARVAGQFADVWDLRVPSGLGARFDTKGIFETFLD